MRELLYQAWAASDNNPEEFAPAIIEFIREIFAEQFKSKHFVAPSDDPEDDFFVNAPFEEGKILRVVGIDHGNVNTLTDGEELTLTPIFVDVFDMLRLMHEALEWKEVND